MGGGETLVYKNSMVTAKQNSVFDIHTKKGKGKCLGIIQGDKRHRWLQ